MSVLIVYTVLAASPQPATASEPTTTSRVVGGSVVPADRYPFMAAVYFDPDGDGIYAPGCGGALISASWVLTAAHCLVNAETGVITPPSRLAVNIGAEDLRTDDGEFIVIDRVVIHPSYNSITLFSDLALLRLSRPYNGLVLGLPPAFSDIPQVGESATIAGWGHTLEGGQASPELLEVSLPIVSHAECLPYYFEVLDIRANVCAGGTPTGGRDSCQGDSGGPLFVVRNNFYVQVGIVSYGQGCARPQVPGVYTRVANYVNWIIGIAPGVQIIDIGGGLQNTDNAIEDIPLIRLVPDFSSQQGRVLTGSTDIYEVTGASSVTVTTTSGDADLYIMTGTEFERDDALCSSLETTPLDTCTLPLTNAALYAIVFGYQDSDYRIQAFFNTQQPANDNGSSVPPGNSAASANSVRTGGGTGGWLTGLLMAFCLMRCLRLLHRLHNSRCSGQ